MKTYSILKSSSTQLSIVLTAIFVAATVPAQEGKEGGGGGNICRVSETQSVLLDLDRRESDLTSPQSTHSGHRIQVNNSESKIGFFLVDPLKHEDLRQAVLNRLGGMNSIFTEQKKMIYMALFNNEITIVAVNRRFNHAVGADFADSVVCTKENTKAVFVYAASILFLSVPTWNDLTLETQADAFVHEGARHMQKLLGVPFTNRQLQTLTWMMLKNPKTTTEDLSFIQSSSAKYRGVAQFQKAFCQYAVELDQIPAFPRGLIQEISKVCENPLLASGESGFLRTELRRISEDFERPTIVQEQARKLLALLVQVEYVVAVNNFSRPSSRFAIDLIRAAIELGSDTLAKCQKEFSSKNCRDTIETYERILSAGMVW